MVWPRFIPCVAREHGGIDVLHHIFVEHAFPYVFVSSASGRRIFVIIRQHGIVGSSFKVVS